MQRRIFRVLMPFLLMTATVPGIFGIDSSGSIDTKEGWKLAAQTKEVTIYSRAHPNSPLREFRATGSIDAVPQAVDAVLDDISHYPDFMPYTVECRLIKREADALVSYQRIAPKICADRDYTLRVRKKTWPVANGQVFLSNWTQANDLGPPEKKGVVRVKVCDGAWLLEPDGATKTRATYTVYTDSGGAIPAFIANHASQTGISRLFAAVRKQVKNPKYAIGQQVAPRMDTDLHR
ncbi:MAG: START domain-containing protein [Verrucomicrobiota bacterium]